MISHKQLLLAEIEFWQEMIDCQESLDTTPAVDRMTQALALAERKLRLIDSVPQELGGSNPGYGKTIPRRTH